MRKLQTTDIFAMARIIRASGVREELRQIVHSVAERGLSIESVGIDGMIALLEAAAEKRTENAIYEALAGPFEVNAASIATMELDELMDRLQQMWRENNLQRFFDLVSRILGKN